MKRVFVLIGRFNYLLYSKVVSFINKIKNAVNTGYQIVGMKQADSTDVFFYPTDKIIGRNFISLGRSVSFGKRAIIEAWYDSSSLLKPEIKIGDNVTVGDDCFITSVNSITIGNNVLIAQKVTITDNSHGELSRREELEFHPSKRCVFSKGPVVIEDNVWIGDKATICPNVRVGKGSVIGANSVVTKDVPPYAVVAGAPAIILKIIE